jgi:hypothetical protein
MEIRRCASRRPGAEWFTLVPDQVPQLRWDAASGRVVLYAENVPSPRDEHSQFDTEVYLTPEDIERIRKLLPLGTEQAEGAAAGRPRD